MEIYTTEKEQIEQLKHLFKMYAVPTLIGMLLAVFLSYGWGYWHKLQERALAHASVRYEQLLTSVANHNNIGIAQQAEYLLKRYPKTAYANLAALLLAHEAVYHNNNALAEVYLKGIVDSGKNALLRQVARIRLARILLAESQPQQALALLETMDDKSYEPLVNEIRGDIYVALNQPDQARDAYSRALQEAPELASTHTLLPIKLDNL